MSTFEKVWHESCENQKIPPETAKTWWNNIQTKYNTESHRIYHNLNILNRKFEFLLSLGSSVHFDDYLVFAIAFQYYQFDLNTDCSASNCTAFREFYTASGVDNVSVIKSISTTAYRTYDCKCLWMFL